MRLPRQVFRGKGLERKSIFSNRIRGPIRNTRLITSSGCTGRRLVSQRLQADHLLQRDEDDWSILQNLTGLHPPLRSHSQDLIPL